MSRRHKYLWKPAYPFRYTKMDEEELAKGVAEVAEVAEVAAAYELRFQPEKHQFLEQVERNKTETDTDEEKDENTETKAILDIEAETEMETKAEKVTKTEAETKADKANNSKALVLYKYDPITKSVYRSDAEGDFTNRRIYIDDVEEMQKQLKDDVKNIQKHIDGLQIKLQCVNRTINYSLPRQSYRDNMSLGIRPCKLCYY